MTEEELRSLFAEMLMNHQQYFNDFFQIKNMLEDPETYNYQVPDDDLISKRDKAVNGTTTVYEKIFTTFTAITQFTLTKNGLQEMINRMQEGDFEKNHGHDINHVLALRNCFKGNITVQNNIEKCIDALSKIEYFFKKINFYLMCSEKQLVCVEIRKESEQLIIKFPNNDSYQKFIAKLQISNNNNNLEYKMSLIQSFGRPVIECDKEDSILRQLFHLFSLNKYYFKLTQFSNCWKLELPFSMQIAKEEAILASFDPNTPALDDVLDINLPEKEPLSNVEDIVVKEESLKEEPLIVPINVMQQITSTEKLAQNMRKIFKSNQNNTQTNNPLVDMLKRFLVKVVFSGDRKAQKEDFLEILKVMQTISINNEWEDLSAILVKKITVSKKIQQELNSSEKSFPPYITARKCLFYSLSPRKYWDEFCDFVNELHTKYSKTPKEKEMVNAITGILGGLPQKKLEVNDIQFHGNTCS